MSRWGLEKICSKRYIKYNTYLLTHPPYPRMHETVSQLPDANRVFARMQTSTLLDEPIDETFLDLISEVAVLNSRNIQSHITCTSPLSPLEGRVTRTTLCSQPTARTAPRGLLGA
jgi:hypothetical protein